MEIELFREKMKEKLTPIMNRIIDTGDYFVVDRIQSNGFIRSFSDALYLYVGGYILLERFYKKPFCSVEEIEVEQPTEEALQDIRRFEEILEELKMSAEFDVSKYEDELRRLGERMAHVQKEKKITQIHTYQPLNSEEKYVVMPFDENSKKLIPQLCLIYSDVSASLFRFLNYTSSFDDFNIIESEADAQLDILIQFQ